MAPDNAMDKISSPDDKSCHTLADAHPQLLEMLSLLKRQAECARHVRDVMHRSKVSEQQQVEMLELVESLRERADEAQKKVARVENVRRILAKERREGEDIEAFARRMAVGRLGCPKDLSPQEILQACDDEQYQNRAPPVKLRRPRRQLEKDPADMCADNAEWPRAGQDPAELVAAFLESLEFCPYVPDHCGSTVTLCMSEYRSRLTHVVRTHIEKYQELMEKDTCSRARSRSNSSRASSDISRHGSMVLTTQVGLSPGGTEKNIPFCRRLESPNIRLLSSNSPVKTVISVLGNSPPSRQRNLSRSRSPEVVMRELMMRTPISSPQPMAPTRPPEANDTAEKATSSRVFQPPRFTGRPFTGLTTLQNMLHRPSLPSNTASRRSVVRFASVAAPRVSGDAALRHLALPAPASRQMATSSGRRAVARFHSAGDTGRYTVRVDAGTPHNAPAVRSAGSPLPLPRRATHVNAQPRDGDISPWSLRKQCSMAALETRPERAILQHSWNLRKQHSMTTLETGPENAAMSLTQFSSSSAHGAAKNEPSCGNNVSVEGTPSCENTQFSAPGKPAENSTAPVAVQARRTSEIMYEGHSDSGVWPNRFALKNCRIGIPSLVHVAPFFVSRK